CGNPVYLNGSHGYIQSPGYMNDSCNQYRDSENCTWEISVGDGMEIELMFNEIEIEKCDECNCDVLKLDDGHQRIQLCGLKESFLYRSTGSWLYVEFSTDSSVTSRGF
ncbi:unnamed protein product, partial [Owenia fusiformis]